VENDRPKYLTGKRLLRKPRRLPPHEKGMPGLPDVVMGGFIPFDVVHRMAGDWLKAYDKAPKKVRDRVKEKGE
jgi:hypothetical protein